MNKAEKKQEILNLIFKSKDGASWNEVSDMLNKFEKTAIAEHEAKQGKRFGEYPNLCIISITAIIVLIMFLIIIL